jgi:hypothetical protein
MKILKLFHLKKQYTAAYTWLEGKKILFFIKGFAGWKWLKRYMAMHQELQTLQQELSQCRHACQLLEEQLKMLNVYERLQAAHVIALEEKLKHITWQQTYHAITKEMSLFKEPSPYH